MGRLLLHTLQGIARTNIRQMATFNTSVMAEKHLGPGEKTFGLKCGNTDLDYVIMYHRMFMVKILGEYLCFFLVSRH